MTTEQNRKELAIEIEARKEEIKAQAVDHLRAYVKGRPMTDEQAQKFEIILAAVPAAIEDVIATEAYTTIMRADDQRIKDWAMAAMPRAAKVTA